MRVSGKEDGTEGAKVLQACVYSSNHLPGDNQIQEHRTRNDSESMKKAVDEYDETMNW